MATVSINLNFVAIAAGTADALTATFTPAITANTNNTLIWVRSVSANVSTTPTITLNGWGAKTITKNGGNALVVGDIGGNGHVLNLVYNSTSGFFELLNPVVSVNGALYDVVFTTNGSGAATVAALIGKTPRLFEYAAGGAGTLLGTSLYTFNSGTGTFTGLNSSTQYLALYE